MTGGAGFLGSNLCRSLLDRGDEVVCLDNLVTGSEKNIEELFGHPRFAFSNQDVTNHIWIPGPIDAIMHLASPASPIDFAKIPIQIMKVGSLGTHNCLGLARVKGAKFHFNSTSEVYGDPLVHPQPETYWGNVNPNGARSMYDEAKRFGEALTLAYKAKHGIDVRIVRTFNTYGPLMRPDDGRVVSNFVTQALRGEPLTVYGDGTQTRSFCYVTDQIEGQLALLDSSYTMPVNIGNDVEFTMLELAEHVVDITNSSAGIVFQPLPEDDPTQRSPDLSVAKRELGWSPKVPLREGLELTTEYFAGVLGVN